MIFLLLFLHWFLSFQSVYRCNVLSLFDILIHFLYIGYLLSRNAFQDYHNKIALYRLSPRLSNTHGRLLNKMNCLNLLYQDYREDYHLIVFPVHFNPNYQNNALKTIGKTID